MCVFCLFNRRSHTRMRSRLVIKTTIRRRIILIGFVVLFTGIACTLSILFLDNKEAHAAVAGDIRSVASGNWNALTTWQRYNGTQWVDATAIPSMTDNEITIQAGHVVTITALLSVDQVVIESGGVLVLNSGITLNLKKLAIPDMKVYGTFRNAGTITIAGGTSITYYSGGKYQHNYTSTAGVIPVGVWNAGSTCEIMGYTGNTAIPTGLNQTFNDFVWNCSSQTSNINFNGGMTNFTGNFIVQSTNGKELQLASANYTFNLTGNLFVTGGILVFNVTANKTVTLNLTGNLNMNGGVVNFTNANLEASTVNLNGNFNISGGTFNFALGNSGTTTINLSGDFTQTGGTLTAAGTNSSGKIVFNKAGTQYYNYSSGSFSGNVDYVVNSGSSLNMGTNIMTGDDFTLNAGGELGIGSPDGISSSGSTGNIQVSNTRNYNAGAYYLYNGSANQITGNGLPSAINKLTVNKETLLTLSNSVTVSNLLNLVNGKINTLTNELNVTNTLATAITGSSDNSYVAGNLRRTISGTGTFNYPVGSLAKYEPVSVTTTAITGATSIVASFINGTVNDSANPVNVVLNGIALTEMLNYGYWTLVPNNTVTAGTYSVTLNEQGYSNLVAAKTYFGVLARNNSLSAWQSIGVHDESTQVLNGSTVTAVRSGLTSFYQFAIGLGDFLAFSNPTLISGDSGQVGATYLFPNIMRGVDGWINIQNIYNGAVLSDIDNPSTGYTDAFQPFITFPPNSESYIEWKIRFKKSGTSTDTTLEKVEATGVDVDGDYYSPTAYVREFIVATMPAYYSLDYGSAITMSNDSGRYKALGPTFNAGDIDTSRHDAMYQLTYKNVSSLIYRTGAINNFSFAFIRQTSLYFRPFLFSTPVYALPIELKEFKAKVSNGKTLLNWITASEVNNSYFTVERSADGVEFIPVLTQSGAGNSTVERKYNAIDDDPLSGTSYYRLRQTDYDGKTTTSDAVSVNNRKNISEADINIYPNPFVESFTVDINSQSPEVVQIKIIDLKGTLAREDRIELTKGTNNYFVEYANMPSGIYYFIITQNGESVSRKIVKL
jgi:hypothetical protein